MCVYVFMCVCVCVCVCVGGAGRGLQKPPRPGREGVETKINKFS